MNYIKASLLKIIRFEVMHSAKNLYHWSITIMKISLIVKLNCKTLTAILAFLISSVVCSQEIPDELKQWQGWVQYQQEFLGCPFFYNKNNASKQAHVCAWPQTLDLDLNTTTGQFAIGWNILQDSWVPLPGDKYAWPQNVVINQKQQIIQRHNGRPRIFLKQGNYTISGEFLWTKRPETIRVPDEIADIDLSIDGSKIKFLQRKSGSLWLGENKSLDAIETNNIEFDVNRLVIDGHPMSMYVVLDLTVSGSARNEKLGKISNQQLQVTRIGGDLSAYIDNEGYLWAQLKPGRWQIYASFNVLDWPENLSFNPEGKNWPKQEIWAYQDDKNSRITQIKGVQPINPEQSFSQWQEVPNYLINAGDVFEIIEQKRGTLNQSEQLSLNRNMWLSFDGSSFRSKDQIVGDKLGSWRLNGVDGYQLLSAKSHNENMLITQSKEGNQGLELRTPDINLVVNAEFKSDVLKNINPWQADFNTIHTYMYLPYGYFPLAATNVDNSNGIWLEKWKLWDIFIVMLMTVFCFKVLGIKTAVVAFLTLVLGYHESRMPLIAWANILLGVALLSIKPNGKLLSIIRSYVIVSILGLLMVLTPFVIMQVRLLLHPQLENRLNSSASYVSYAKKPVVDRNRLEVMNQQNVQSYDSSNAIASSKKIMKRPKIAKQRVQNQVEEDSVELGTIVATGSKLMTQDTINRYQTGSVLQAGKGVPQWKTNHISLSWDGPISAAQQFNLILLPPIVRAIWRLLLVVSSVLWLLFLLQKLSSYLRKVKASHATTALIFVLFVFPSMTTAQNYPSNELLDELQKRINPSIECKNNCASMDSSQFIVNASTLQIDLSYHALEDVVVDIPYSADWSIEDIIVNGKTQTDRIMHLNRPWIKISKGINKITLTGSLANRNNISINYPMTPGYIITEVEGWQIAGVENNLLINNTLQLISTSQKSDNSEQIKTTDIKPFVSVKRFVTFDDNWSVETTVERLASNQGALNLPIPLLTDEHPIEKLQLDKNGHVMVSMGPTARSFSWRSRIDKSAEFTLLAAKDAHYLETWQILASPQWNIDLSGVPIITPHDIIYKMKEYYIHTYKPRPGEKLNIKISRPDAIEGDIVSIESINTNFTVGKRATKSLTTINYRATQGGNFEIQLDEKAEINSVSYDGVDSNLTNENGLISVGFLPGNHKVVIDWQVDKALGIMNTTPSILINSQYTNIQQKLNISRNRWVLFGYSEGVGPAFLYWGEFLFFTVLAFFLAKLPYSLLKFWQWLVLGYAFGTVSWFAFGFITLWLFFIGWKKQQKPDVKQTKDYLLQWFALLFTVVTLIVFISSVAFGLLSYPQMGITGQGSYATNLNWYLDVHQGQLPSITIFSLPIWCYKGIMLVWSIWVSFSLLSWLKQFINSLDKNLWWKKSNKKVVKKSKA